MHMIQHKLKFAAAAVLALGLASCDMNLLPKDGLPTDESLQTVSDLQNWWNGRMANLRNQQGGIFTVVQDLQADQISVTVNQGNHYTGSLSWESCTASDYDRRDVYISYYQALTNINFVFENLGNLEVKEGEKSTYNILLGRHHFYRAYCYANLALRYGTPYNAASAGTDLCVPLLLEFDPVGRPARATNQEVYNQILNVDLAKAKELLAGVKGEPGADEITIDAVTALEARVKLYMSDWSGALAASKSLIDGGNYPLVEPDPQNFVDMWVYDAPAEEILMPFISRPKEEPRWANIYYDAKTDAKRSDGKDGCNYVSYLPFKWVVDMYSDKDLRKPVYFEMQECNIKDNFYNFYVIAKQKGNPNYASTHNDAFTWWGGYVPDGMVRPKIFRIAEQYLIASEAAFKAGQEGTAKEYLNALRISRGLDKVTASGSSLYQAIKDERTRELAFEGFRLWDLRRWGEGVKRHDPQVPADGSTSHLRPGIFEYEYQPGDFHFVWPITANDINTNENIKNQQNPGW